MDNPFDILSEKMNRIEEKLSMLLDINKKQVEENNELYISPDECRALFYPKISKSTLYRWTRDGLITKYLTPGKKPVYKKSEITSATKTLKNYSNKKTPRMEMQKV